MSVMNYDDVTVRISPRAAPRYTVAVTSPQGSCESTLELPFTLEDLTGIVFGVAQTVRDMTPVDIPGLTDPPPDPAKTVRFYGEKLFEALFQGDVRSVLDRTRAAAQEHGVGVRIRLSMDLRGEGMTEVASLPWELMWREGPAAAGRLEPDPARPRPRHPPADRAEAVRAAAPHPARRCRTRRGPRR